MSQTPAPIQRHQLARDEGAGSKKRMRGNADDRSTNSQLKKMSLEPLPTISSLQLEAIFYPKFDNEKSDQQVRRDMIQHIEEGDGYLEVTLKHSGSLVLWSGGPRFYSKNATDNCFTAVAQLLLIQHFERAWRTQLCGRQRYQECSNFLEEYRLTLAFEVVTAVLGDHGDRPNRDFCMLTAVADRSQERFYSTPELLRLAQRFRLPHNDAWVFASLSSVETLFDLYDTSRETGLAKDMVQALDVAADETVSSMYPHTVFQGNILEGFIIRYIPFGAEGGKKSLSSMSELAVGAKDILRQVPPELPPSFEAPSSSPIIDSTNIRDLFRKHGGIQGHQNAETLLAKELYDILAKGGATVRRITRAGNKRTTDLASLTQHLVSDSNDRETQRIAKLLQALSQLNKTVLYAVEKEECIGGVNGEMASSRWLCMIHVMHDQTFYKYHKEKEADAMNLFRGFCIELSDASAKALQTNDRVNSPMKAEATNTTIPGMNQPNPPKQESLMLKMKLLPYMIRTFIVRNNLSILEKQGVAVFMEASRKMFARWEISKAGQQTWIPFLQQWATFAKNCFDKGNPPDCDLPPLRSYSYLSHLEYFTRAYESGDLPSPRKAASSCPCQMYVVAVAPAFAESLARHVVKSLGFAPEIVSVNEVLDNKEMLSYVCYASLKDPPRKSPKKKKDSDENHVAVVFYNCTEDEVEAQYVMEPDKERKKALGLLRTWRKQNFELSVDLGKDAVLFETEGGSSISVASTSAPYDDMIEKLRKYTTEIDESLKKKTAGGPGILTFFAGIPGCGKSCIVNSMDTFIGDRLGANAEATSRKVIVQAGDKMGKCFWPSIKTQRSDDSSCVVVADRNAPPISWDVVGRICGNTLGVPVAVLPDGTAMQTTRLSGIQKPDKSDDPSIAHFYPFSLGYLAVCISRVLSRPAKTHIGKLDVSTPHASMVVVGFYALYRSISAEEMGESIIHRLANAGSPTAMTPVTIPFFKPENFELPEDLKDSLEAALRLQFGYERAKTRIKDTDETILSMEARLRASINVHKAFLDSCTVPLDEVRKAFSDQLIQRISSLSLQEEEMLGKRYPQIKLVSLDVTKQEVHRVLRESGAASEFLKQTKAEEGNQDTTTGDECYPGEHFVNSTHMTMAYHTRTTQQAMRDKFADLLGSQIDLVATRFLWSHQVAALAVEIVEQTNNGKVVPRSENAFPHITVWFAEGAEAKLSNNLPAQLETGKAQCVTFTSPIPLSGSFSYWDFENHPIPNEKFEFVY